MDPLRVRQFQRHTVHQELFDYERLIFLSFGSLCRFLSVDRAVGEEVVGVRFRCRRRHIIGLVILLVGSFIYREVAARDVRVYMDLVGIGLLLNTVGILGNCDHQCPSLVFLYGRGLEVVRFRIPSQGYVLAGSSVQRAVFLDGVILGADASVNH